MTKKNGKSKHSIVSYSLIIEDCIHVWTSLHWEVISSHVVWYLTFWNKLIPRTVKSLQFMEDPDPIRDKIKFISYVGYTKNIPNFQRSYFQCIFHDILAWSKENEITFGENPDHILDTKKNPDVSQMSHGGSLRRIIAF